MPEDTTLTPRTLVDLLRQRAERYEDKVAFSFSYNGDDENPTQITYRELDVRARAIAASLQAQGAAGERVLVLCSPGLDPVAGFFGCAYAGAVAVPVHQRLAPRLKSVVPDAQASFALATAETQAHVRDMVDGLVGGQPLRWCALDTVAGNADEWVAPNVEPSATALVQYTSGSTTSPKGVLVTHRNVLHNVEAIRQAWHGDDQEISVFWLPPHHDAGLIGCIFLQLYVGTTTYLMSPTAFIKRPMQWLEAISRHRGTYTIAPNFAYEMCVARSTPEERAALDLSSLATAVNGAEPVQGATLRAFADAFASTGFRIGAFSPAYGLAEATVMVSGGTDSPMPVVAHIDRTALQEDRVADAAVDDPATVELVACGPPQGGQDVVIVDPVTRVRCAIDEVGEIWVAGPSVADGYQGKPEETKQTFGAFLAETGEGPFLRTGDLGFLRSGELFVTGRVKDLVVLDGRNYYPNDIELTVQGCHPAFLPGRGAIFAVTPEQDGAAQLVVVQEVGRNRVGEDELTEMVSAIQTAVTKHHGIQAHSVVLVEPMRIPTTSSGKIQRSLCRQQFLDRELDTLAEWHAALQPDENAAAKKLEAAAKVAEFMKVAAALQHRTPRQT